MKTIDEMTFDEILEEYADCLHTITFDSCDPEDQDKVIAYIKGIIKRNNKEN